MRNSSFRYFNVSWGYIASFERSWVENPGEGHVMFVLKFWVGGSIYVLCFIAFWLTFLEKIYLRILFTCSLFGSVKMWIRLHKKAKVLEHVDLAEFQDWGELKLIEEITNLQCNLTCCFTLSAVILQLKCTYGIKA